MRLLISHMRAGSHLAAKILGCRPFVAHDEKTGDMMNVYHLLGVLDLGVDVWTYSPYNQRLAYYIRTRENVDAYLLLRDPRDIIVSTAHFCEKYPNTFMNWEVDGVRFAKYSLERRIDFLIDDILEHSLFDYDRWRRSRLFTLLRYRDIINHPIAKVYQNWLRRGVKGSYKDEMTPEQIERSTEKYKELIEAW
jgi:hypothetical protein